MPSKSRSVTSILTKHGRILQTTRSCNSCTDADLYTVVCFFVFATSQCSVAAGFCVCSCLSPAFFFPLASFPDCIHVRRTWIGAIGHHWMTHCFIIIRHSQQKNSSAHVLDQSGPFTSQTGFRLSHPLEGCRSQSAIIVANGTCKLARLSCVRSYRPLWKFKIRCGHNHRRCIISPTTSSDCSLQIESSLPSSTNLTRVIAESKHKSSRECGKSVHESSFSRVQFNHCRRLHLRQSLSFGTHVVARSEEQSSCTPTC